MKRLINTGGLLAATTAILTSVMITAPAMAQPSPPYYGPHMWGGGWWMLLGPLTMILFLAAIVALVVLLVRWLVRARPGGSGVQPAAKTPLQILQERFARGEIDKEEFEERRRTLGV
jgi:putative membrane protein